MTDYNYFFVLEKETFANRDDTRSIIRHDAFRKTLPQAAEKKSRTLTDRGKQLISRALISNKIFSSHGQSYGK